METMKILLVNGSPHRHGCTDKALEYVALGAADEGVESEVFWLGAKPIAGCMGCGACKSKGACAFDDVVNELAAKADEADGIVLGTPVHYAAASGQITSAIHRLFYSHGAALRGKVGAAVVSCRRGGAASAFDQLNKYFSINQMPIATSRYWNQVHGNTPEEVEQDQEGIDVMRQLGRNMAWLVKCIKAGEAAGIGMPTSVSNSHTNFIR